MGKTGAEDWAGRVRLLREKLNLSQEELAARLGTNQCSISRWERGVTRPGYRMRALLLELEGEADAGAEPDLELIRQVAQEFFDGGQLLSLLLARDGTVVAVSSGNRPRPGFAYKVGVRLQDQTLPEDMENVRKLEAFYRETGFWDTANTCFAFDYEVDGDLRCVVLTSVVIGSRTFCLMQGKEPRFRHSSPKDGMD